jgi:hypothetical protein
LGDQQRKGSRLHEQKHLLSCGVNNPDTGTSLKVLGWLQQGPMVEVPIEI